MWIQVKIISTFNVNLHPANGRSITEKSPYIKSQDFVYGKGEYKDTWQNKALFECENDAHIIYWY